MKKLALLLCLLSSVAWGSKILSYNVYDRHERVDVMLTFDTPYEGVLRQNQSGQTITIKLEEASIDSPLNKTINSTHLQNIAIVPSDNQILITAKVSQGVVLQASKTSDSYGLRLRFTPPSSDGLAEAKNEESLSSLPTKDESEFERSYYVVIGILVVGIAILFWLKQSIAKKTTALKNEPSAPWLFSALPKPNPEPTSSVPTASELDTNGIHIRFQKTLDSSHSVAMLDFGTMSYLVLLGNNTIVLDKFQDNIPISQNDFEALLHSKHRELDGFFQLSPSQDETFDAYKEKASII